jgi:hypothetical protein
MSAAKGPDPCSMATNLSFSTSAEAAGSRAHMPRRRFDRIDQTNAFEPDPFR